MEWTSGGGVNASGGRVNKRLGRPVHLDGDGEQAVVARAGRGGEAIGDFALDHEYGTG